MPKKLFVLEIPDQLSEDALKIVHQQMAARLIELGHDADLIVLDDGWSLKEVSRNS